MSQAAVHAAVTPSKPSEPLTPLPREWSIAASTAIAWCLVAGLPVLGVLASVCAQLPVFAALMTGSFLLSTTLACRKALVTFTGRTLQLLVTARLAIILVVGALLFCISGSAWMGLVSALLLWLVTDRLLGRRALHDLWKLGRDSR